MSPTTPAATVIRLALLLAVVLAAHARAGVSAAPLDAERLRAARRTINEPDGDRFLGTPAELSALVDALAADCSRAGPVDLFLGASTAHRLGRIEDAGFLFYAARLRTAFELERHRSHSSTAGQYLAFLNETVGQRVAPAIMADPRAFAAAVARLERWSVPAAENADLPEFAGAEADFKVPAEKWPALEAEVKEAALGALRRSAALLGDPEYFAAFKLAEDVHLGKVKASLETDEAYARARQRMKEIEAARFPAKEKPVLETWEVEKGRVWYHSPDGKYLVEGADPETIRALGGGYAQDSRHVFQGRDVVKGADPATFTVIDDLAGRDAQAVYIGSERCEACDAKTFRSAGAQWYVDAHAAYYRHASGAIPGADAQSFEALNQWMAKDRRRVYFMQDVVVGADADSFKLACAPCEMCGQDRNRCYSSGYPVPCDCKNRPVLPMHSVRLEPGKSLVAARSPINLAGAAKAPRMAGYRVLEPGSSVALTCWDHGREGPVPTEQLAVLEADRAYRFVSGVSRCEPMLERSALVVGRADAPEIRIRVPGAPRAELHATVTQGKQELNIYCRDVTRSEERVRDAQWVVDIEPNRIYRLELAPGSSAGACDVRAVLVGAP